MMYTQYQRHICTHTTHKHIHENRHTHTYTQTTVKVMCRITRMGQKTGMLKKEKKVMQNAVQIPRVTCIMCRGEARGEDNIIQHACLP